VQQEWRQRGKQRTPPVPTPAFRLAAGPVTPSLAADGDERAVTGEQRRRYASVARFRGFRRVMSRTYAITDVSPRHRYRPRPSMPGCLFSRLFRRPVTRERVPHPGRMYFLPTPCRLICQPTLFTERYLPQARLNTEGKSDVHNCLAPIDSFRHSPVFRRRSGHYSRFYTPPDDTRFFL